MSLNKIGKQLRREATANPKKAAILGLLAVVALWFWAPLVMGWLGTDDAEMPANSDSQPKAASPAKIPTASLDQPETETEKQQEVRYPWQEVAGWMDNDPQTAAATMVPTARDPFMAVRPAVVEVPQEPLPDREILPEVTPQGLGMVLSSTIIGPRRCIAMIDGKSYVRGKKVRVVKDGQAFEFTLVEVHPRRVLLERDGTNFELRAPVASHSGRIELTGDMH